MSSKKRVSVFARLGPAGPTSPDQGAPPSHRRYSSDKHLDKGHHSHPLPPPPHTHPHPGSREDSLRERKPSHQDYEDKKQMHYRDVPPPPPPLPSTSRHRSHKHYHDNPDHMEYSEKPPRDIGRSEKRPSLSSPLPPPPPAPRKSRDLADRLSPTGKDILSKPFMGGYEDKLTKLSRSSSGGSSNNEGGRGGGKGKRGSPPDGGTVSEGEVVEIGEEGRRKRNRPDKKTKLEDEVGRRQAKTAHHLPERERKEKGGERESRHGWPEKKQPPPSPSMPTPGESLGGGEVEGGREGRGRQERGGASRPEEREGRRKREEDWPEPRELVRKRKRENSEGTCTPPPDTVLKRTRTSDPVSKELPSDSTRDEKHSRQTRDTPDPLERKRRYESSVGGATAEPDKAAPPAKKPRSGETASGSSSRKLSRGDLASSSSVGGSQRRKTDHHKGRGDPDNAPSGDTGEASKTLPKLDWSTINALSLPRPKPASTSAVQRFSPGALFSRLGVSRSLAGSSLFQLVSSAVAEHLAREEEALSLETGNQFPEGLLEQPFGEAEFAMTGVSGIRSAKENCRVCVNIGPNRQALLASADFALRRKLGKTAKGLLPPSPSSSTWSSEHFSTARDLYNSLGTKASGKPAFRLEPSEIGSILIPK